jgi:hypothetical protein
VPIEPALLAERSQDGESEASIERAKGRMPILFGTGFAH